MPLGEQRSRRREAGSLLCCLPRGRPAPPTARSARRRRWTPRAGPMTRPPPPPRRLSLRRCPRALALGRVAQSFGSVPVDAGALAGGRRRVGSWRGAPPQRPSHLVRPHPRPRPPPPSCPPSAAPRSSLAARRRPPPGRALAWTLATQGPGLGSHESRPLRRPGPLRPGPPQLTPIAVPAALAALVPAFVPSSPITSPSPAKSFPRCGGVSSASHVRAPTVSHARGPAPLCVLLPAAPRSGTISGVAPVSGSPCLLGAEPPVPGLSAARRATPTILGWSMRKGAGDREGPCGHGSGDA